LTGMASRTNCTIIFINQLRHKVMMIMIAMQSGTLQSTGQLLCSLVQSTLQIATDAILSLVSRSAERQTPTLCDACLFALCRLCALACAAPGGGAVWQS
jgi:hypothetical protein